MHFSNFIAFREHIWGLCLGKEARLGSLRLPADIRKHNPLVPNTTSIFMTEINTKPYLLIYFIFQLPFFLFLTLCAFVFRFLISLQWNKMLFFWALPLRRKSIFASNTQEWNMLRVYIECFSRYFQCKFPYWRREILSGTYKLVKGFFLAVSFTSGKSWEPLKTRTEIRKASGGFFSPVNLRSAVEHSLRNWEALSIEKRMIPRPSSVWQSRKLRRCEEAQIFDVLSKDWRHKSFSRLGCTAAEEIIALGVEKFLSKSISIN